MYRCPVCNTASQTFLCSHCGFDISCDYPDYPTLDRLPEPAVIPSPRQEDRFLCPECGGARFIIDRLTYQICCAGCGRFQGAAHLRQADVDDMVDVTAQFAGSTVTIHSVQNGKYLCADSLLSDAPLTANRSTPLAWEIFTISPITDDGWIGIRAHNGKYLSAMINMENIPVMAQGNRMLLWEQFRIFRKGSAYYLHSRINDKWLSVCINSPQAPVRASADAPSAWERMEIHIIDA